ncbi:MAG: hypothetical protein ACYTX0_49345, partial [Nostoc sp.]
EPSYTPTLQHLEFVVKISYELGIRLLNGGCFDRGFSKGVQVGLIDYLAFTLVDLHLCSLLIKNLSNMLLIYVYDLKVSSVT